MAKRQADNEVIAVVSDPHCGSTVGLLPPEFTVKKNPDQLGGAFGVPDDDGERHVPQNDIQRWLWPKWLEAIDFVRERSAGARLTVIVCGDAIEGHHHGGDQAWSKHPAHHLLAAEHCLSPLRELADRMFIVRGTQCHVGNHEHELGERLAAERDPITKLHSADHWSIDINGVIHSARHHCSATSRKWLESGEFSRLIQNERANAVDCGWPVPAIMHRGHRHVFGYYTNGVSAAVISGAWQLSTRFVHKIIPGGITMPSVYVADHRGRSRGELPAIDYRLYRPEPSKAHVA